MKKAVLIIIAIIVVFSLSACKKSPTFDDLSYLQTSDYEYTINSIDGTTFILYGGRKSQNVPGVGDVFYSSEKATYSYTLEDGNVIVVDGKQYSYEIDSKNGTITFSPSFLGIATKFDCKLQ